MESKKATVAPGGSISIVVPEITPAMLKLFAYYHLSTSRHGGLKVEEHVDGIKVTFAPAAVVLQLLGELGFSLEPQSNTQGQQVRICLLGLKEVGLHQLGASECVLAAELFGISYSDLEGILAVIRCTPATITLTISGKCTRADEILNSLSRWIIMEPAP